MANRIPARLSASEGRKFGVTLGVAFLALAFLAWWRAQHALALLLARPEAWGYRHWAAATFAALAAALIVSAVAAPTRLAPVERVWMGMAHALSRVTTPIFMGVVYFVILTPVGLALRVLGRNPLAVTARDGSAWAARADRKGDLTRQF